MYTSYFSYNFYQNFILSFIFLSINLIFIGILSNNLKNKKILLYGNFNFLIIFYLIFLLYSSILTFSLIFNIQKYLIFIFWILLISELLFILMNISKKDIIPFKIKKLSLFDKNFLIVLILLILFFFISILPISDADSIAYHLNSVLHLFENTNNEKINLEQFLEFSLLSNTEILLLFSIIFSSDNFGSQLNFISISIFILFFYKEKKLFSLVLLSCPLIIFFVSTQKLQIFYGLLYLILFYLVHDKKIKSNFEVILFTLLIFFYSSGKISYILFFFPLYFYFLILNLKKIKIIFYSSVFSFLIVYFPLFYLKYLLFQNPFSPFFYDFFNYNKEIFEPFVYSLRSTEGWLNGNIKNFFLPFLPLDIFELASSLGLCFLLLLLDFKLLKNLHYIPIISIIIVLSTGQILPRYFLEIFLILSFFSNQNNKLIIATSIIQLSFVVIFTSLFLYKSYYELNVLKGTLNYKKNFSFSFNNNQNIEKLNLKGNILTFFDARPSIYAKKNIFSTRYLNVKNISKNGNERENLSNFIIKNKIKFLINNDENLDLIDCIQIRKINEVNFSKKFRNFLIQSKTEKSSVFLVNNTCNNQ